MSYNKTEIRPIVGSIWVWEPHSAPDLIWVTEVRWNGEEWFIRCAVSGERTIPEILIGHRPGVWNDLDRFWKACHFVRTKPGPPSKSDQVRRGEPYSDEMPPADS